MTDDEKRRTWLWINEHGTDGVPTWEVEESIAWFINDLNGRLRRENIKEDQNEHQRT